MTSLAPMPTPVDQPPPLPRLIDLLLAEQQTLPAVERFAQWHDNVAEAATDHASQIAYRSLIPLSRPEPGEQYAFEVDLDVCSGCKACVTACHSLNGLDEHETWRDVGLLLSGDDRPSLQYVTTACHHCVEPACLAGCPVKAYDKDPVTGIVRHLDDQCIGCHYCVLMCPYDVPKYSHAKGIVRKCDMCRQRLAADAPPACVAACPNHAIRITTIKTEDALLAARAGEFLPSAPHPGQTKPTTRYLTTKTQLATWHAADAAHLAPAHAHWPLVVMLVLTQASVGILLAERCLSLIGAGRYSQTLLIISFVLGAIGGQTATLHLGRPFGAWRAWLGLSTSWLSREIVLFGGYSGVLAVAMIFGSAWFSWLALAIGAAGVFSSAMIYAVTERPAWCLARGGSKFLLTTLVIAGFTAACVQPAAWPVAMILVAFKLIFEQLSTWKALDEFGEISDFYSPLSQTCRLLRGPLGQQGAIRFLTGGAALVAMFVASSLAQQTGNAVAIGSLVTAAALIATGELLERMLFFTSCASSKMPGGFAT